MAFVASFLLEIIFIFESLCFANLYQLNHTNNDKYNHIKYYYIDCEINNNNPIFTYIIKEGWSELRIGKILFEKEGLTKLLQ